MNLISDCLSFDGTSTIEKGKAKANTIAYDCPSNEVITHYFYLPFLSSFKKFFGSLPCPSRFSPSRVRLLKFLIVVDPNTEAQSESKDRVWRKSEAYCKEYLDRPEPILIGVSAEDTEFAYKTFIELYQGSNFAVTVSNTGRHAVSMAGSNIRDAVSSENGHHLLTIAFQVQRPEAD